jgi:hypothetical protein
MNETIDYKVNYFKVHDLKIMDPSITIWVKFKLLFINLRTGV